MTMHFLLSLTGHLRYTYTLMASAIPNCPLQASWVEGGLAMTFEEILDQAIAMLQRRGRLTYRTLQRQFQLDDAALEDLKDEIIYGQRLAVDEEERVLVWTGEAVSAPASAPPPARASAPARAPLSYTPSHLTEKILAARTALAGERKQ